MEGPRGGIPSSGICCVDPASQLQVAVNSHLVHDGITLVIGVQEMAKGRDSGLRTVVCVAATSMPWSTLHPLT